MKLLLTAQHLTSQHNIVVPYTGGQTCNLEEPVLTKELLAQIIDWAIADVNVMYKGFTIAVIEMERTPSRNICGRITTAQGVRWFLAEEENHPEKRTIPYAGTEHYTCFGEFQKSRYKTPVGLPCDLFSEEQGFTTEMVTPDLNTLFFYNLTEHDTKAIQSIVPDIWLSINKDCLRIPLGVIGVDVSTRAFDALGVDNSTSVTLLETQYLQRDVDSYYTFGDLIKHVDKLFNLDWKEWAIQTTPVKEAFAVMEKIPFDHTKSPLKERTFSELPDSLNTVNHRSNFRTFNVTESLFYNDKHVYLLKLLPDTLTKQGDWYLADFEPIILATDGSPFDPYYTNIVVKKMNAFLQTPIDHFVVANGDDPAVDANVKLVVEARKTNASETIKLQFTTKAPSTGAEEMLTQNPDNFILRLIPHMGQTPGTWDHFSNMVLCTEQANIQLDSFPTSAKPVISGLPKFKDLPRDSKGNVADVSFDFFTKNPGAQLQTCGQLKSNQSGDHCDQTQKEFWENLHELNGSVADERMRFQHATLRLWMEFCNQSNIDPAAKLSWETYQTFADMTHKTLISIMRKLSSDRAEKFINKLMNNPPSVNVPTNSVQVIKVDCGVIVSDSLNHLVGLKINLESGTWTRHTDGGDWIRS